MTSEMKRISIHSGVFFVFLILSIAFCCAIPASASETEADNAALIHLEGVFLKVVLGDPIIGHGLSIQQIENELKTKLASAGIRILSLAELREIPGSPILIVEAESIKLESLSSERKTLYSFVTGVSLFQLTTSDKNIAPIGESTWDVQHRGVTYDLTDIRLYLVNLVDKFIRAYRLANSKG